MSKNQKITGHVILALIAAGILIVSFFLPLFSVKSELITLNISGLEIATGRYSELEEVLSNIDGSEILIDRNALRREIALPTAFLFPLLGILALAYIIWLRKRKWDPIVFFALGLAGITSLLLIYLRLSRGFQVLGVDIDLTSFLKEGLLVGVGLYGTILGLIALVVSATWALPPKTRTLTIKWALAAILILFSIFPVLWIVSASINPVSDLANQKLIPDNWGFENFRQLVENPVFPFFTWLKNSLIISTVSTLLTLSLTTLAAFAFSRFRFRGRQGMLKSILLIQSFPNLLAIVALFTIIKQIGDVFPFFGLNTHAGLILVYSGGAMGMNIWLMKGYMDTIPRDIDESAHVDGATDWEVFSKLILPLLRPILVVISILSFIGTYGEFIIARTLLTQREMQTVMVGLQIFTAGQYTKNWGVFAAGALIAALPIMIIYLILQDQIVGGLTQGAVKG